MSSPHKVSVFLLLAGCSLTRAQPAGTVAPHERPSITFSESVFDFGTVKSTDVLRHSFKVTNTGEAVLELTDVKPACGCTIAENWDRKLAPGQSGRITIQFSPANFEGSIAKSITVTSNDPADPTHVLQIQANVWRPVDIKPASLYFTPVEGEKAALTKVARIINHLEQPMVLESPQSSNPAFQCELRTVRPGQEFELQVSLSEFVSAGAQQGSITMNTSSPEYPLLTISAAVIPQPSLAVIPPQITLPGGTLENGFRQTLIVSNNGSLPMALTESAANVDGIKIEVTERQPGKMYIVDVSFPSHFHARTDPPPQLSLHTSNPKHPLIVVPIELAANASPAAPQPRPAAVSAGAK